MLKRKRMMHNINFTKQITQKVEQRMADEEDARARRRQQHRDYFKDGLAGKRMGSKYKVEKGEIDVQLTEDLSDNLRGLKVRREIVAPKSFPTECNCISKGGRQSFTRSIPKSTTAWSRRVTISSQVRTFPLDRLKCSR